ncbi:MAG: GGDEF domain-containing protein [Lachnospiraceae bacterium]|nr:GGDEF domain-containing protein [Lachnospiraceae bacterium]
MFYFFDVDNLKMINDYYGHDAGDRILHIMGDTLKANNREHLCCRLGGDEFLLYVPNVSQEEAVETVEKVIIDFNYNKKDDIEVDNAGKPYGHESGKLRAGAVNVLHGKIDPSDDKGCGCTDKIQ